MKQAVKNFDLVGESQADVCVHKRPQAADELYTVAHAPSNDGQSRALEYQREYAELRRLIVAAGLLKKAPAYYWFKISLTLGLYALSLGLLILTDTLWLQLMNAVFLAFVFTQATFLVHDAGHHQIFRVGWKNEVLGILLANFLLGMSYSWWRDNHNQHHAHPNEVALDPDMNIPVYAFSREQARGKTGVCRLITKYQAYLFWPMTLLVPISKTRGVILFLFHREARFQRTEVFLTAVHVLLYAGVLFSVLVPWHALLFIIVHQSLYGMYMATIVTHNHIGRPLMPGESGLGFLRHEVITTRDLKSRRITNFWWGGVNYHIEHHLFSNMPRCHLRAAHRIVKSFCEARSIPYTSQGAFQSYKETTRFLYQASSPLRDTPTSLEQFIMRLLRACTRKLGISQ
jgi:fatty acid desaturase